MSRHQETKSTLQTVVIAACIPAAALLLIGGFHLIGGIQKHLNDPNRKEEVAKREVSPESERARREAVKNKKEQELLARFKAAPEGERPAAKKSSTKVSSTVQNSAWDGSVRQVDRWVKSKIADPEVKLSGWSQVVTDGDTGISRVQCDVRARNAFGGWVMERWMFTLDRDGNVLLGGSLNDFRKALQAATEK
jgi:hypothetical protein